jgi:hypothetical protein
VLSLSDYEHSSEKDKSMRKKKQVYTPVKKQQLPVKTNLKAGEHCNHAFNALLAEPCNSERIGDFVSCCQGDSKCLHNR